MPFGTTSIDPGATPSVPVARDSIGGDIYQRVKIANPNADNAGAYGIDSDPIRVRPRRKGTADYDSGNVAVANGAPASVTTSTVNLEGGYVSNNSTSNRLVTIQNTADLVHWAFLLGPQEHRALPIMGGAFVMVGIEIGADGTGVTAGFWGTT